MAGDPGAPRPFPGHQRRSSRCIRSPRSARQLSCRPCAIAEYPQLRLVVFDEAKHYPQLDEPERFNGEVSAFLANSLLKSEERRT